MTKGTMNTKIAILAVTGCLFLNGCMAAAIPIVAVGVAGAAAGVVAIVNMARDQYPDIDFEKPAPVETVYARSFNEVWNGVIDTLMEMKESNAMMDKNSGVIRTNKKNLNDVSWIGKGLGKATFLYELNITVREKNGKVSVEVMVPFWEEKAFVAQKEKNIPEGSNMMRHIFYRNLNKRVPPAAVRLPDSPLQDIRFAPTTKEGQPKDTVQTVPVFRKTETQDSDSRKTGTVQQQEVQASRTQLMAVKQGKGPVNVRTVPSTQKNMPIATLKAGDEVEKIDEKGSWCKIRFTDGNGKRKEGWIAKSYLD
ncbi:MAG: Bacterial SH3 domain protein [Syntrophorhabdus sp. PtaU1.Bin153]|nr:MAG: Bacterial SH3 domain protein [Syntrophorhabdus sp. PtaU1.Bin153]